MIDKRRNDYVTRADQRAARKRRKKTRREKLGTSFHFNFLLASHEHVKYYRNVNGNSVASMYLSNEIANAAEKMKTKQKNET